MTTKPMGHDGFEPRRRLPARQLQLLGVAGMLVYIVLSTAAAFAITGPSTHPTKELFPFFTWSLFSQVSNSRTEYHVSILALDGRSLDPPLDMRDIDAFPAFGDSKSLGYKALQNVGKAIRGDDDDGDEKRQRFAARYFGDHQVDYRINRHRYNPLTRWREGPSADDVEMIGRFSHGDRP